MGADDNIKASTSANGTEDLTPDQARIKRDQFLALAEQQAALDDSDRDEVDSADSTMATLILPGG